MEEENRSICSGPAAGAGSGPALGMAWLYTWTGNDQATKLCTAEDVWVGTKLLRQA